MVMSKSVCRTTVSDGGGELVGGGGRGMVVFVLTWFLAIGVVAHLTLHGPLPRSQCQQVVPHLQQH